MNPTLVFELVMIQMQMIVKNDYKRFKSKPTLVKEAGFEDQDKYACIQN